MPKPHGIDRMLAAVRAMDARSGEVAEADARHLCQELHDAAGEAILVFGTTKVDPGKTIAALCVTISDETARILREWPTYRSPSLCEAVRTVAVIPMLRGDFTASDYRAAKPQINVLRAQVDAAFAELRRQKDHPSPSS